MTSIKKTYIKSTKVKIMRVGKMLGEIMDKMLEKSGKCKQNDAYY